MTILGALEPYTPLCGYIIIIVRLPVYVTVNNSVVKVWASGMQAKTKSIYACSYDHG